MRFSIVRQERGTRYPFASRRTARPSTQTNWSDATERRDRIAGMTTWTPVHESPEIPRRNNLVSAHLAPTMRSQRMPRHRRLRSPQA